MVSPLSSRLLGMHNVDGSMISQIPLAQLQQQLPPPGTTPASIDAKKASNAANAPSTMDFQFLPSPSPSAERQTSSSPTNAASTTTPTGSSAAAELPQSKITTTKTKPPEKKVQVRLPSRPDRHYRPISSRTSGYSADQESSSSSQASNQLIRAASSQKERRALEVTEHAKKRKIEEVNYAALTVKEDLEKVGKNLDHYKGRARALPLGSVDMTRVQLLTAEQYDKQRTAPRSNGALYEQTNKKHSSTILHKSNASACSVYDALVSNTRHFYNGTGSQKKLRNSKLDESMVANNSLRLATVATGGEFGSCRSSATPSTSSDTDSDSASLGAIDIAPRSEEALDESDEELAALTSPSPPAVDAESSTLPPATTIEMALSYSEKARLVVKSRDPFHIVHANAAYFRLTEQSSAAIVGQPLTSMLEDNLQEGGDLSNVLRNFSQSGTTSKIVINNPCVLANASDINDDCNDAGVLAMTPITAYMTVISVLDTLPTSGDSLALMAQSSSGSTDKPRITHYLLELCDEDGSKQPDDILDRGSISKSTTGRMKEGYSVIG